MIFKPSFDIFECVISADFDIIRLDQYILDHRI